MARSRNIKPGFFTNEELVELPFEVRLLFIGLWTLADREGRLEYRPKKIKMSIFPADDVDVAEGLQKLEDGGFLFSYRARIVDDLGTEKERQFYQIVNWHKHQKPHHMEAESLIPPPVGSENRLKHKPIYKKQRERIFERDGRKCVACESTQALEIDHIVPVSKGGTSDDENLQVLCRKCNGSKGAKTDESLTNRGRIVESASRSTDSLLPHTDSLNPNTDSLRAGSPETRLTPSKIPPDDFEPQTFHVKQIQGKRPDLDIPTVVELFRHTEYQYPRTDWDAAFYKFALTQRAPLASGSDVIDRWVNSDG